MSDAAQLDVFGGETPLPRAVGDPPVVSPRVPGWYLVATRTQGPKQWHLLTTGSRNTVVTVCGLTGHTVLEQQRVIVRCPVCEDAMPELPLSRE